MNQATVQAPSTPSKLTGHPCFDADARHKNARVHLPVASRCNVQCNFCDRKYSCVNESRPGVTSSMLKPYQALQYLHGMMEELDNLSVVGIAGPGDPFANPEETLETLRLVREAYPDMMLCVASNGLNIVPYLDELAALKVSHVTITVNAVQPEIGQQIYAWMRYNKRTFMGEEAARYLWTQQLAAIRGLKARGIIVKINTILIPGINADHVMDIAKTMADEGVDVFNLMPLYPTPNTAFANLTEPTARDIARMRLAAGAYLPQMGHCARCRADAAGMLGDAQHPKAATMLREASQLQIPAEKPGIAVTAGQALPSRSDTHVKPVEPSVPAGQPGNHLVAVASMEGLLVNQHLGEATNLHIYDLSSGLPRLIGYRPTPSPGGGDDRWKQLAQSISDCSSLLVGGIGPGPRGILAEAGITIEVLEGLIEPALLALQQGKQLGFMTKRSEFRCGSGCSGTGNGCG